MDSFANKFVNSMNFIMSASDEEWEEFMIKHRARRAQQDNMVESQDNVQHALNSSLRSPKLQSNFT